MRIFSFLISIAVFAVFVFTIAGFASHFDFANNLWPLPLFGMFVVQYFVAALIGLGIVLLCRKWFSLAVLFIALCLNISMLAPHWTNIAEPTNSKQNLMIFSNTQRVEANADAVTVLLQKEIQKNSQIRSIIMGSAETTYNRGKLSDEANYFDGWVTLQGDLQQALVALERPEGKSGMIAASYDSIVAVVHPHAPIGPNYYLEQRRVMKELQENLDQYADYPQIIMGDFNANPGSPVYNEMIAAGYKHAQCGRLWDSTWPVPVSFMAAKLDHFFVTENVKITCKILPATGSDHRAIMAYYEILK